MSRRKATVPGGYIDPRIDHVVARSIFGTIELGEPSAPIGSDQAHLLLEDGSALLLEDGSLLLLE